MRTRSKEQVWPGCHRGKSQTCVKVRVTKTRGSLNVWVSGGGGGGDDDDDGDDDDEERGHTGQRGSPDGLDGGRAQDAFECVCVCVQNSMTVKSMPSIIAGETQGHLSHTLEICRIWSRLGRQMEFGPAKGKTNPEFSGPRRQVGHGGSLIKPQKTLSIRTAK